MTIGIIGLGYVGLPLANAFAKRHTVIGVDINQNRINELKNFDDVTLELTKEDLKVTVGKSFTLTNSVKDAANCNYYVVTVPTPITLNNEPDLTLLINATKSVSTVLKNEDIVIFESTVYPGVTEDICVPILEKGSGLVFNKDFQVGYSPERINPGDKKHTITQIKKVISGSSKESVKKIFELYSSIIDAGVYVAESIKVAEAAKVIENTQRDLNIAFINELAQIFHKMGIDTNEVLKAASTKWNFLNFKPGLVGGHCIGVDPYYLSYKSKELGYDPKIILSGRETNQLMPKFIFESIKKIIDSKKFKFKTVLILGATFKENCPDIRNSKSFDLFKIFDKKGFDPKIYDPIAKEEDMKNSYVKSYIRKLENRFDIIVVAVGHSSFLKMNLSKISYEHTIIYDVKSIFPRSSGYLRL
jgi:UDP-N-acetyl-D-galactosamine dehydrogenase